jgi:hypothetical protein
MAADAIKLYILLRWWRWWNFLTVNWDFKHDKEVEEKCTTGPFCDRGIVCASSGYLQYSWRHGCCCKSCLPEEIDADRR